jgi:5-methyltetrahydrofolate--homocysteine methyltransferase
MTPAELLGRLQTKPLLLDGGLGTMLISMGLSMGRAPEAWNLEYPDRVTLAHRRYVQAGSEIIHANTFGATPPKLAASGLQGRCVEINSRAVGLARAAAGPSALVAGDLGPTGLLLPPMGDGTEQQMEEAFGEQAQALASAGVDLLSLETLYDLREASAAVRAARETRLAMLCSMTFEVRRRGTFTIMGDRLVDSLRALHEQGATVVGFNCTVTSEVMIGMVKEASERLGATPLVAQPNAGQPRAAPSGIHYDASPEPFAADLVQMIRGGARVVGGCCGTDDRFIRAARGAIDALDWGCHG